MKNSLRISMMLMLVVMNILCGKFAQAQSVSLEEGTQVRLKLMQELSSASAQAGQTVNFEVIDSVKVGNTVVIAEGAPAMGTIVEAEAKRSLGRGGKLAYQLEYVKAVDGSRIPIRATSVSQGKGKSGTTGALVAGTAVVFFPAAPLFLLLKGKDTIVPRGQHIDAFIDGNRSIQIKDDNGDGTVQGVSDNMQQNSNNSGRSKACLVNVVLDNGNGDIEVDGIFYGSTPSSLKLPVGFHTITVKRAGYKPWERSLNLAPGTITLRVEMENKITAVRTSRRR